MFDYYRYSGRRCESDIDECSSNPCQHGGTCRDFLNYYKCECHQGFSGINCEVNIDDCRKNPCKNGGSCIDHINAYECVCILPYTGKNCQEKFDPCNPNQCQHGARCSPNSNFSDFSCTCRIGLYSFIRKWGKIAFILCFSDPIKWESELFFVKTIKIKCLQGTRGVFAT